MQEQISMHLQGTEFVASRMMVRDPSNSEPTLYQIYGLEDDTKIQFEVGPGTKGVPIEGLTLDRGESYTTWVTGVSAFTGDFVVHAEKPIMMAAYMGNPPPNKMGSPSMVQLAPVGRHLADYLIHAPPGWEQQVVVIARPMGATITLDGAIIDDDAFTPAGEYEVARLPVEAGTRHFVGSEPFSLLVNGVRENDGYAYLGGWATPTPAFPPPK
jgi:hypothetical protein